MTTTLQVMYLGDDQTVLTLDCKQDITAATALSIDALHPDGTTERNWPGTAFDTTKVRRVLEAADADAVGDWIVQAKVEMNGGTWYGRAVRLRVLARFAGA